MFSFLSTYKGFPRFLLWLVLPVLLFTGCNHTDAPCAQQNLSGTVSISCGDLLLEGTLYSPAAGINRLELTAPAALAGIAVEQTADSLRLDYAGFSYTCEPDELPSASCIMLFFGVLDAVRKGSSLSGSDGVYNGVCASGEYSVTMDRDGILLSITLPARNFIVRFS